VSRPSHPAPNTRDDREAPLFAGTGYDYDKQNFWKPQEEFLSRAEQFEQPDYARETRFFAHFFAHHLNQDGLTRHQIKSTSCGGVASVTPRLTTQEAELIVVTTENVTGHRTVRMLGQCFGVVVRSRGLGGNVMAGLRSIVGGEIHEYTQMLEEARRHALDRLVHNATAMGANAILMMRFDSAEIGNTMSEIVAYGTAAVIEPAT